MDAGRVITILRTGVFCETWALQAAVIPAKAGIYSANLRKCADDGLDSRFRGNDECFERDPIPNDTTTRRRRNLATNRFRLYNSGLAFECRGCWVPGNSVSALLMMGGYVSFTGRQQGGKQ